VPSRGPARHVQRAFYRGRHTRNLYRATFDDALLARRLGDVRKELGLAVAEPRPRARERVAFVAWSLVAGVVITSQAVLSPLTVPAIAIISHLEHGVWHRR